jgi:hypothetical protein
MLHATRCNSGLAIASAPFRPLRLRFRSGGHQQDARPRIGDRVREADLAASQVTTIGVNSYLWRAALDTLSFAPMAQVDSNGGVIVTDWYANPNSPNERVKVTATILDRDLRADALRVAASRQVLQAASGSMRRSPRRPCRSSRRSSSPAPATCAGTPSPARGAFRMAARFNPLEADARWQKVWEEQGTFHASDDSGRPAPTSSRCSPIRRGASTWAMSATTRWATCSPAIGG